MGISCFALKISTKLLNIEKWMFFMLIGAVKIEGLVLEIPTSLRSSE